MVCSLPECPARAVQRGYRRVMLVWVALGLVLAVFLTVYATWTAARLDRLHARLDAAATGLDQQLKSRAMAAAQFCGAAAVPLTTVGELAVAAMVAAEARGLGPDREGLENRLTRAIRLAADVPALGAAAAGRQGGRALRTTAEATPEAIVLADAMTRAGFARRFYNDAVRDVIVVRNRRVVRSLHLAGRAKQPHYFEIDDAPLSIANAADVAAPYD